MHPRLDIWQFREQDLNRILVVFIPIASKPWTIFCLSILRLKASDVAAHTVLHFEQVGLLVLDIIRLVEFVQTLRAPEPEHERVIEKGCPRQTDLECQTIVAFEIDESWGGIQQEALAGRAVAVRLVNGAPDFVAGLERLCICSARKAQTNGHK